MLPVRLLLAVALLAAAALASSSSGGAPNHNHELSGSALTRLYNQPVYTAERMRRPLGRLPFAVGVLSHTGVRVTLQDGQQWLIHKGEDYGISSQTVVTNADNMSPKWKPVESREFGGTKTVADFVAAGGADYKLSGDNCHDGSQRMMNQ